MNKEWLGKGRREDWKMLEAERAAVGKAQEPLVELKVHCGWGLRSER